MSTFTILLGGDVIRTPRLDRQVEGSRVIAADAGIGHARLLGLVPELWVGDFDSVPANLPDDLASVPRRTFPAEKDQTDGELAITAALERGATRLVLAGAFGGRRADHAFLHLALALRLAEAGTDVLLTSGAQEGVPLLHGTAGFDYADGTLFSVLGFSELSGLTVTGAKWPLAHVKVAFGSSLTISNEVKSDKTGGRLEIALGHGRAMLLAHPYPLPES
ncbi:thiamine diphosphokinase [Mesorhizobium sp. M7A.F.Ca.US.006.01.1.1]|uniref:thiamine diphosphokinase n=1 Tax=Mesorhizobium sp. M7A.F.Ca.US.006.01.1.1 TaxID=2496707 RepID=UPI000FCAA589|nr:thiamine diphosphokinase [Mesorhizobium sp. M7A.F.Ca.US.006.01.1.1]RUZ75131.1 thiamine diphosphokinase [Mesorhizobium sp. M7A.F.Ca.US.006.01.1.1]